MSELHTLLADAINELTRSRIHREPYLLREHGKWITKKHKTAVSSLLDQLGQAVEPGGIGDTGRGIPGSRSAARLEAVDTLLRIDAAAASWLTLRCHRPLRASTADNLRALVGCASDLDETALWELTREARRWATMARVTTGWEVPPFRPANSCPLCAERGTLRIRVGDGVSSYETWATCTNCAESWDPQTVGLLAEHIRAENGDEPLTA
jgi:hypothetical protein